LKRYRYITNGTVLGKDKICDYRLIASNNMTQDFKHVALRVNLPDDLVLEKWSCDPYSTTEDERTLDELGYDLLVWNRKKKKWLVHNKFKGTRPCDIPLNVS